MDNKEKEREISKRYRETHREELKKRSKAYRKANPEKVKAYNKLYCANNKEKIKEFRKAYRDANRERIRGYGNAYSRRHIEERNTYGTLWREANPEYGKNYYRSNIEKYNMASNKRRALKNGTQVEHIDVKKVYLRDGWVCQICYKEIDKELKHPDPMSVSIDHIIPLSKEGAHTYDNIQMAHLRCNFAKGNKVL